MVSFYNVLANSIKAQARTRAEYETIIATWLLNNFLTADEASSLLALLDEYYPVV